MVYDDYADIGIFAKWMMDAPKLKKGYGGANGNKISILLNDSRWMLKFPSISE